MRIFIVYFRFGRFFIAFFRWASQESVMASKGSGLFTWLATACVAKPVIMTGAMLLLRAFHDPLYANPICAARCVGALE